MVKWSNTAKCDLRQIHDYILKDSNFYAKKVVQEIIKKTEELEQFPNIGRVVPEINDPRVREVIIYSYRIIYQLAGSEIEILALVHSRRNFPLSND